MKSFINRLKSTLRLEQQWAETRMDNWELDAVPHLDCDPMAAPRDFLRTVAMPLPVTSA